MEQLLNYEHLSIKNYNYELIIIVIMIIIIFRKSLTRKIILLKADYLGGAIITL